MREQIKCECCKEAVEFRVGCQHCGRLVGPCCEAALPTDDERSEEPLCEECF